MASRFVVAVALFAVCHSSPVIRDGRSYGIGSSSGPGVNKATASVDSGRADAYGFNDNLARDAYSGLGQAFAKASNDNSYNGPVVVARAEPAYYPVPAPATITTYQHYADVPETSVYQQGLAQSSASSLNGGIADSNAKIGNDDAASNARVQGDGQASSFASNGGIFNPVANNENLGSTIVAAKTQNFRNVYTPVQLGYGAASSNANSNGHYGSASSSAKTSALPARKSISWRFGTAYDGHDSYHRSVPSNLGYDSANANANVNSGQGIAKSDAQINAEFSSANSAANANSGFANANANVNKAGYATLRLGDDFGQGFVKADSHSYDQGIANANANVDAFGVKSASSTIGNASAKSSANGNPASSVYRANGWGSGGRASVDTHSRGYGNANSSARTQGVSTGFRVVDTNVNSQGTGSAAANAYSV